MSSVLFSRMTSRNFFSKLQSCLGSIENCPKIEGLTSKNCRKLKVTCGFGPKVWIIGLSTKHVSDLGQWLTFSIIDKVGRVALPCLSPLLTQLVPVREKLGVPAHKNWNSYALVLAPASKARENLFSPFLLKIWNRFHRPRWLGWSLIIKSRVSFHFWIPSWEYKTSLSYARKVLFLSDPFYEWGS